MHVFRKRLASAYGEGSSGGVALRECGHQNKQSAGTLRKAGLPFTPVENTQKLWGSAKTAMAVRGRSPEHTTSGVLQMPEQINSDSLVLLDLPEVVLSLHA